MKLFIMHDDRGKIRGTFAARVPNAGVKVGAGLRLHTFEHEDLGDAELRQYLHELRTTFRVSSENDVSTLVKLDAPAAAGEG